MKKSNVLLIFTDALGFSELGCYGSEIEAPNLDQLTSKGLRFTQFYNSARCCPSRASVSSGLYTHQAGVGELLEDFKTPGYSSYLKARGITIHIIDMSAQSISIKDNNAFLHGKLGIRSKHSNVSFKNF